MGGVFLPWPPPFFCVPPLPFFPRDTRDADAQGEASIAHRGYFYVIIMLFLRVFTNFQRIFGDFLERDGESEMIVCDHL